MKKNDDALKNIELLCYESKDVLMKMPNMFNRTLNLQNSINIDYFQEILKKIKKLIMYFWLG